MECKNCKETMEEEERSFEDGMVVLVHKCDCGWSVKSWYDLENAISSNDSWLNDKGEDA